MAVLAYAVFLQPDATHPVGVLNPDGYRRYGARRVRSSSCSRSSSPPIGTHSLHSVPAPAPGETPSGSAAHFASSARRFRTARSWRSSAAGSLRLPWRPVCTAALSIYFNTYFWELTSSQISVLVLIAFVVRGGRRSPPRRSLSRRFGKKRAAIGVSLAAVALGPLPIVLRLLELFPANASPKLLPFLLVVQSRHHHARDHVRHSRLRRWSPTSSRTASCPPAAAPRESSSPRTRSFRRRCRASASSPRRLLLGFDRLPERRASPARSIRAVVRHARPRLRAGARRALSDRDRLPRDLSASVGSGIWRTWRSSVRRLACDVVEFFRRVLAHGRTRSVDDLHGTATSLRLAAATAAR